MKLFDQVRKVFDDAAAGDMESAMLHACTAVDATARRLYPSDPGVRSRFVRCVREYCWLVEPMLGTAFNLVDTRFGNVVLKKGNPPDFAQVVYEVHRCAHAHGDEVPITFELMPTIGNFDSQWVMGPNALRIPDRLVWALCSIAVFSRVNHRLRGQGGGLYLSWGDERFPLSKWWGREEDLKPRAIEWNSTRVTVNGLEGMLTVDPAVGVTEDIVIIPPPPPPVPAGGEQG